MDTKRLEYFILVAESGSVTRAAASARVAQPVVSRHVGELERDIGARLFYRDGRGVTLTAAGQEFYRRTKPILRRLRRAIDAIQSDLGIVAGPVSLGVPPHIGSCFIGDVVARFLKQFPMVELRINEGFSRDIVDWLETGKVDVGLLYDPRGYRYIVAEEVAREQMFLVAKPGLLPETTGGYSLESVHELPLILPSRPSMLLDRIDSAFRSINLRTPNGISVDSFSVIKYLVRAGEGFSILGFAAMHEDVARGELVAIPITEPPIERSLAVASPRKGTSTQCIKKLDAVLREAISERVQSGHWNGVTCT